MDVLLTSEERYELRQKYYEDELYVFLRDELYAVKQESNLLPPECIWRIALDTFPKICLSKQPINEFFSMMDDITILLQSQKIAYSDSNQILVEWCWLFMMIVSRRKETDWFNTLLDDVNMADDYLASFFAPLYEKTTALEQLTIKDYAIWEKN